MRAFYAMARGSACECAAILDIVAGDYRAPVDVRAARELLVRIVQMLTKLSARMRGR
jgi:hypothetical protein